MTRINMLLASVLILGLTSLGMAADSGWKTVRSIQVTKGTGFTQVAVVLTGELLTGYIEKAGDSETAMQSFIKQVQAECLAAKANGWLINVSWYQAGDGTRRIQSVETKADGEQ